jgi:hypothetical protein
VSKKHRKKNSSRKIFLQNFSKEGRILGAGQEKDSFLPIGNDFNFETGSFY